MRKTIQSNSPGISPDDRLFDLKETQEFLRLSRSATFELLKRGEIPYVRQFSRRYIWRSDLVNYLNARRVGGAAA